MPDTYKVRVDIQNRSLSDRYFIDLFKTGSSIQTASATLLANDGLHSHTFIDLVNDSYSVRVGHECVGGTLWTDKFPVSAIPGNANTQCKKPVIAASGGAGIVTISTTLTPSQGLEVQIFRDPIVSDPPASINSDGKVLVKASFFAAPVTMPVTVTGLGAGPHFVKSRSACSVTATVDTGGSSTVVIYSDWTAYNPVTIT